MRITSRMMTDNAIRHMADGLERVNKYSQQIATGKQFQNASDDPVTASLVMQLKSTLKTSEAYRNTTQLSNDWMSATDYSMDALETAGNNAYNKIIQGVNDTLGADERKAIGAELDGILQQAVEIGNTSHNGQYIFGGYQTDAPPFTYTAPDTIAYTGDDNVMMRTLGPGQSVAMNIPGRDAATGQSAFVELFQNLLNARDQLNANDTTALRVTMNALKSNMEEMGRLRTSNGARQRQVLSAADYLDKVNVEVSGLLNEKEGANVAEALANMRSEETAYQTVLEVSQRTISALNLFDYLN